MAWNDENLAPSVTQETDAALVSLGQRGAVVSDGVITGNFAAIQMVQPTTFDAITALYSDYSLLLGQELPVGFILYGPFTEVGCTGGLFIAYKA